MTATKEDAQLARNLASRGILKLLPKTRSSDRRTRCDAIELLEELDQLDDQAEAATQEGRYDAAVEFALRMLFRITNAGPVTTGPVRVEQ